MLDPIPLLFPLEGLILPRGRGEQPPQRQYLLLLTAWDCYLTHVPSPKSRFSTPSDIHWHARATLSQQQCPRDTGTSSSLTGQAEFVGPEGALSWANCCCQLGHWISCWEHNNYIGTHIASYLSQMSRGKLLWSIITGLFMLLFFSFRWPKILTTDQHWCSVCHSCKCWMEWWLPLRKGPELNSIVLINQ